MSETERLLREMRARIKALEEERDRLAAATQTESDSVFSEEERAFIHANSSSIRQTTEVVDPLAKVGEALYYRLPPRMRTNKQAGRFGRLTGLASGYVFGSWLASLFLGDDK